MVSGMIGRQEKEVVQSRPFKGNIVPSISLAVNFTLKDPIRFYLSDLIS